MQEQRTGGAVSYVSFQVIKKRSPRAVCLCRCRAIGNGTLILGLLYRVGWKSQRQGPLCAARPAGTGVGGRRKDREVS